jgi:hypothetical protein
MSPSLIKPDSILRGMDRFIAEVQQTESAGDRWRWVPSAHLLHGGLGLMAVDGFLFIDLLGYRFVRFHRIGGFALMGSPHWSWRGDCVKATRRISPRATTAQNRSCTRCAMT